MKIVERHEIRKKIAKLIYLSHLRKIDSALVLLRSGKSPQLIEIFDISLELLHWTTVAGDFDSEVVLERLRFAANGYSAWTEILSNPRRPVFFNYRGAVLTLGKGLFKGALEDYRWTQAWLLAKMLGLKDTLTKLHETRKEVVSPEYLQGVSQYQDVSYLLFEMFYEHKGIHPESCDAILEIIEGSEIEPVPEAVNSEMVSLFFMPSYFKAMKALHAEDESAFSEHLYQALEEHKKFWSQEHSIHEESTTLHRHPAGFHSLYLTQLLAQAAEKGIHPEVESEYMAEWVLMEL